MNEFISYLKRMIEGCESLGGMQREKAVYQSILKEYRKQCNLQIVSVSFCPKCNSKNIEPYNTPSCECKDCKAYWAI